MSLGWGERKALVEIYWNSSGSAWGLLEAFGCFSERECIAREVAWGQRVPGDSAGMSNIAVGHHVCE